MDKIKVCHIITKLELGGAQQNTLYTVAHLNRDAYDVSLIAGAGGILDGEAGKISGVRVTFVKSLVRTINPAADLISLIRITRLLRNEKPAVVHTHSSKAGIIGRWAAWFAGVPHIVHTFHGHSFNDFQPWPVKALYLILERLTARITNRFIAVADEDIRKGVENRIGNRNGYSLIRSGIDTTYYKSAGAGRAIIRKELGIAPNVSVVLTVGPFKPQKNLKDYITVAGLVAARVPGCVFLVIGDGALRPALENAIDRQHLQGVVRLLGWRRDVKNIMAAADVFVMTSLWEGLPRTVLEAMCAGLPVVANAVDGTKEIVADGASGYLVQPFAVDRMAELVSTLLQDRAKAAAMGNKGKELVGEQFDIRYMVRQQEELYQSLLHA